MEFVHRESYLILWNRKDQVSVRKSPKNAEGEGDGAVGSEIR